MNRMLILYIFLLLCGTVSAQQTVEWNDLQPLTDDAHRTVYYKKDSKRPLQGKYRIIRGLDEEHVKLSDGMINGDYHRYRDGVLRESGIYVKGKRNGTFTEYYQDGVTPRKETPAIRAIQQNFGYFIKRIFMGIEIMNHILVRRRIETSVATPYGNESHYSCRQ